jgi:hypothetical protein
VKTDKPSFTPADARNHNEHSLFAAFFLSPSDEDTDIFLIILSGQRPVDCGINLS